PTIADGRVFVGTSSALAIFGVLVPPTVAPIAPSNLSATAISATKIKLTWTDNANNEGAFKIERSTDNVNFTQIALASANATTYTDSTVNPSTLYYYRVSASNIIGDSAYSATASATTPPITSPVDIYHFDEGAGTATVDSAGANNGTLIGVAST